MNCLICGVESRVIELCESCHEKLKESLFNRDFFARMAVMMTCIDLDRLLELAAVASRKRDEGSLRRLQTRAQIDAAAFAVIGKIAELKEARIANAKAAGQCMGCEAPIPVGGRVTPSGQLSALCESCSKKIQDKMRASLESRGVRVSESGNQVAPRTGESGVATASGNESQNS